MRAGRSRGQRANRVFGAAPINLEAGERTGSRGDHRGGPAEAEGCCARVGGGCRTQIDFCRATAAHSATGRNLPSVDSNDTERALPVTTGRRAGCSLARRSRMTWLRRRSILVASVSRHDLDQRAYPTGVLRRLAGGETDLDSLPTRNRSTPTAKPSRPLVASKPNSAETAATS